METSKKIKTDAPELGKDLVRRRVMVFFKGCQYSKCFSPHCPHYIGGPQLSEIRADPENNLNIVLQMIQRHELQISCDKEESQTFPFAIEDLLAFRSLIEFNFLRAINLNSEDRIRVFEEIKATADNGLASLSSDLRQRLLEIVDNRIAEEVSPVGEVLARKVKDADFFECLVLFFLAFGFILDIENFHCISLAKKFLEHLSLIDFYTPDFRQRLQTAAVQKMLNSTIIERINENLQNLLALQIAELDSLNKVNPAQAHSLAVITCSITFLANLNSFLPASQQLSVKDFVNETLVSDFDPKIATLFFMRDSALNPSFNRVARLIPSLYSDEKFMYLRYPAVLSVETKVDILHFESKILQSIELQDKISNSSNPMALLLTNGIYLELKLRRDNLLEDALNELASKGKGSSLRQGLKIKFVGEPGVDEGGLTKEFFQLLTQQLFDPSFGMFVEKNERYLWFDSKSFECNINFELIGNMLGLALYNETILPLKFPLVVYKKLKLANHDSFGIVDEVILDDLKDVEPEVHSTLVNILNTNWTNLETGMTFSVTYDFYGSPVNHELIPGGAEIEVTEDNKKAFVDRYLQWFFNESVQNQFQPFCRGFYNVISKKSLSLFTAYELFLAICGNEELNFRALHSTTKYEDYNEHSETIAHFWQILEYDFANDQKKAFLKFLTGSDRAPLKGLGDIKMTITRYGPDSEHLPASHTCFNHLLLPDYKNYQKLRTKLLKAVENCEGFGLF